MSLVPCIICNDLVEAKNKKVIAKVCDKCNGADMAAILKNINYTKLKAIINKKQLKITKDGEII